MSEKSQSQQEQQWQQQLLSKCNSSANICQSKSPEDYQSVRGDCEDEEKEFHFQGWNRTLHCNLQAIKCKRLSDITYIHMVSAVFSLFEEEFAAIFEKKKEDASNYLLSLIWTDHEGTKVTLNSTHELQTALKEMTHFHFKVLLEPQTVFRKPKDEKDLFDDSSNIVVVINITCDKCWEKLGVFSVPAKSRTFLMDGEKVPPDSTPHTENLKTENFKFQMKIVELEEKILEIEEHAKKEKERYERAHVELFELKENAKKRERKI